MTPENQNQPNHDIMNSDLKEIEALLAQATPAGVPGHLLDRIETGLHTADAGEDDSADKVVPFPGRASSMREPRRSQSWSWRAVAAVAMLGALFAWFIPQRQDGPPIVVSSQRWDPSVRLGIPAAATLGSANPALVPASVKSRVGAVRDEGVVWPAPGKAMRKIRVTYLDVVKAKDDQGRTVEATIPRVQYVLVPEQVD